MPAGSTVTSDFATRPDEYTSFYQWNRTRPWPATGTVTGWNSVADNAASWTVTTPTGRGPCPTGWRLPTQAEFQALHDAGGNLAGNVGGVWVAAGTRGAAVPGRFYGPRSNATPACSLPADMTGCIFLPAVGYRFSGDGGHQEQSSMGYYRSSTEFNSLIGYTLNFSSTTSSPEFVSGVKAGGFNIRCVR